MDSTQNADAERGAVRALLVAAGLWILLGGMFAGLAGCSTNIKNQGEVGIRYGTEITFFSRAAQTAPEPATASVALPSLEAWFRSERAQATLVAPEP